MTWRYFFGYFLNSDPSKIFLYIFFYITFGRVLALCTKIYSSKRSFQIMLEGARYIVPSLYLVLHNLLSYDTMYQYHFLRNLLDSREIARQLFDFVKIHTTIHGKVVVLSHFNVNKLPNRKIGAQFIVHSSEKNGLCLMKFSS